MTRNDDPNTQRSKRSEAARKAAATRQKKQAAEWVAYKRKTFRVFDTQGKRWCIWYIGPNFAEDLDRLLDEVVEYVDVDDEKVYHSMDMTIVNADRIVAVVRRGTDGQPVVTKF
jgi:hypothetical protein